MGHYRHESMGKVHKYFQISFLLSLTYPLSMTKAYTLNRIHVRYVLKEMAND